MPKPKRRGFTLIELLVTLAVVGVLMTIGFPKMRTALLKAKVRSARSSVITLYNQARARAIREGRSMTVHFDNGTAQVWITGSPRRAGGSATCFCDTVDVVRNLGSLYGVTVSATPDSFRVDARGLGVQPTTAGTAVILTRAGFRDSILISGYGRIAK